MKTEYEIQNTSASLFGNEALLQLITNLEKLDFLQGDVLDNLNRSLNEKRAKLENLHSRIIRIFQILKFLETVPQALTILSKKFYPENIESYIGKSIYYNDICDFNLASQCLKFKNSKPILNEKLLNTSQELGKQPTADMDDIKLSQDILNSLTQYRGMREKAVITNSSNLIEHDKIDSQVEMLTSIFNFTTRTKVFGDQLEKSAIIIHKNSQSLNQFLSKKDIKNIQKPLFSPPQTLKSDIQIRNFERHKETVKHKTMANIEDMVKGKIKSIIGLESVVDIEIDNQDNNHNFKYTKYDDSNVEYDYGNDIYPTDDIGQYQTPMDKIKSGKIKPSLKDQAFVSTTSNLTTNNNVSNTINVQPPQIVNYATAVPNVPVQVNPPTNPVVVVTTPVVPVPQIVSTPNIPPVPQIAIVAPKTGNIPKPPPLLLPVPKAKPKPANKPAEEQSGDKVEKKEEIKKPPPKDNPVRINILYIDGLFESSNSIKIQKNT